VLIVTGKIRIPLSQIKMRMTRSGGPGGQHVNTSSTAIQLSFDVGGCALLNPVVKQRLKKIAGSRMTHGNILTLDCREHRSLERNKQAGLNRLADLIRKALVAPKKRKATKPTRGSQKRRLESKKKRSQTKASRSKPKW
jgi:ribosome-associated protein